MKKGKEKEKKKKSNNSPEKKTKQTAIFDGFLVYEKVSEEEENFQKMNDDKSIEGPLNKWLIMQHNSKETKSRFSNLFKEIQENDKKEGKNIDNDNKNINSINDQKLISNNLMEKEEKNIDNNNVINNMNEAMKNLKIDDNRSDNDNINNNINDNINNNINENIINLKNNDNIELNNMNNLNNINIINNNFLDDSINKNENNNNIPNNNVINNNFPNINNINNNNNKIMNQSFLTNYTPYPKKFPDYVYSNNNSVYFPSSSTSPSSTDYSRNNSLGSSGSFYIQGYDSNNNINLNNMNINNKDNFIFSNNNSKKDKKNRPTEKKFDLNIDIKRIIYLEDRRTTLMIKNIPNKFNRDALLKTIDENFKGAYDLFILPTDANGSKNFGYSFINFTNCYYIPYFYFLFHEKKWSSTNSQKVCQITYSKIQGRNSLLSHYSSKMVFKNSEVKKYDVNTKFIIPNEYYNLFLNAFPNFSVDKFENYFVTKMPFRY